MLSLSGFLMLFHFQQLSSVILVIWPMGRVVHLNNRLRFRTRFNIHKCKFYCKYFVYRQNICFYISVVIRPYIYRVNVSPKLKSLKYYIYGSIYAACGYAACWFNKRKISAYIDQNIIFEKNHISVNIPLSYIGQYIILNIDPYILTYSDKNIFLF